VHRRAVDDLGLTGDRGGEALDRLLGHPEPFDRSDEFEAESHILAPQAFEFRLDSVEVVVGLRCEIDGARIEFLFGDPSRLHIPAGEAPDHLLDDRARATSHIGRLHGAVGRPHGVDRGDHRRQSVEVHGTRGRRSGVDLCDEVLDPVDQVVSSDDVTVHVKHDFERFRAVPWIPYVRIILCPLWAQPPSERPGAVVTRRDP
jgi:hypothetical protein